MDVGDLDGTRLTGSSNEPSNIGGGTRRTSYSRREMSQSKMSPDGTSPDPFEISHYDPNASLFEESSFSLRFFGQKKLTVQDYNGLFSIDLSKLKLKQSSRFNKPISLSTQRQEGKIKISDRSKMKPPVIKKLSSRVSKARVEAPPILPVEEPSQE